MVDEDYVSFETAKLLKKRGFDENCRAMYSPEGDFRIIGKRELHDYLRNSNINEYFGDDRFVTSPTFQEAMKWMRNVYKIHFEILMTNHSISILYDIPKYYWVAVNTENCEWVTESTVYSSKQFKTNEEACDNAIKCYLEKFVKNEI